MRDRDSGRGRNGAERGDPGHDLEWHAGLGQRQGLLATAPEDERVAALQADDVQAALPVENEPPGDLFLLELVAADQDRVRRSLRDKLGGDEPVVDEHVARPEEIEPARRDQARVARAGADEVDGHSSDSSTSASKKSRRSP